MAEMLNGAGSRASMYTKPPKLPTISGNRKTPSVIYIFPYLVKHNELEQVVKFKQQCCLMGISKHLGFRNRIRSSRGRSFASRSTSTLLFRGW